MSGRVSLCVLVAVSIGWGGGCSSCVPLKHYLYFRKLLQRHQKPTMTAISALLLFVSGLCLSLADQVNTAAIVLPHLPSGWRLISQGNITTLCPWFVPPTTKCGACLSVLFIFFFHVSHLSHQLDSMISANKDLIKLETTTAKLLENPQYVNPDLLGCCSGALHTSVLPVYLA